MDSRITYTGVIALVLLFLLAVGVGLSYQQVPAGNEGVVKQFGAVTGDTRESGAHLVIPGVQTIQNVETRPRTYTMSNTTDEGNRASPDAITVKTVNGSSVDVDLTVRYRIDPAQADGFVRTWNDEPQLEQRLIRPTVRSVLRDEASSLRTTGDGAIYKTASREQLGQVTRAALETAFEEEPVILEAVQIRNVGLPTDIDQALDAKEEAKQRVQVEQERIQQEEARAEQQRVQAQAEADVIRIKGESLRENEIVLQERYIQALQGGSVFVVGSGGSDGGVPVILDASGANASASGPPTNTTTTTGNTTTG